MNARKLSTGPITSSYQWPTHRPTVHACPTRSLDNRLDRFDGSDGNYLIGYYGDTSTRVHVILRCRRWLTISLH